jgi:cell pole-organizing protein PopZ
MPSQSPVPGQSVEEILSSIRQAIADDEARRGRVVKPLSQTPAPTGRPSNAAQRALASANDDDWDAEPETDFETQNVIDLAIEKAIDGVSAALNEPPRVASSVAGGGSRGGGPVRDERRPETRAASATPQRPLLSARSGAAVAASFEDLARNVASLTQAQVNDMAQEMLRPMLKSWLDDNLPNLVERLVREEIERVSRGR